jgi:hypothetical protein
MYNPLPYDISRCSSKSCKLECRRKENGAVMSSTPFADLSFALRGGKCEFQIKPKNKQNYEAD